QYAEGFAEHFVVEVLIPSLPCGRRRIEKRQGPLHADSPHRPPVFLVESGSGREDRRQSFGRAANRSLELSSARDLRAWLRPTACRCALPLASQSSWREPASGCRSAAPRAIAECHHVL